MLCNYVTLYVLQIAEENKFKSNQIKCISITIPLGKQVHPCKLYACLPLLFTSLSSKYMHFNVRLLCHHTCSM